MYIFAKLTFFNNVVLGIFYQLKSTKLIILGGYDMTLS